jgi:hypothetical protein
VGSCRSLLIKFIHFGHGKPKRLSPNQLPSIEGFMSTSKIPDVEWQCLIKGVIRPFYSRLVELLVWQGICIVQRLLKLQPFSPQLLLAHLKSVFSTQWVSYVNDMGIGPWVSWDYGPGSQCKGPSPDWLCLFWMN